jgi:hypothetical protein
MFLVLALLLILIFGGLGFAAHVLWWGLIIGVVLAIVHTMQRGGRTGAMR